LDCSEDAECGEKSVCIKGACWPIEEAIMDVRGDSSFLFDPSPQSRDVDVDTVESTDIGTVSEVNVNYRPNFPEGMDAAVDFDEPIYLPEPETVITSTLSSASLVGVWEDESVRFWGGPIRLSIEEASDGSGIIGRVTFLCDDQPDCEYLEPPSPALDPNVGYPTGISAQLQFEYRMNVRAKFDYRVFEGRVVGNRFSFWITNNDLWRDWCAMQTPYPFENDGRQEYSCVPEPRFIDWENGFPPDLRDINGKEILCSVDYSACKCSSDTCDIDYRSSVRSFDLSIDDDVMRGTFVLDYGGSIPVTLIRLGEQQS